MLGGTADSRQPVVGYLGSCHEMIYLPLIEWRATQRPYGTFLLVGHAAVDVSRLERLPNVVLAGAQPYASLPRWARAYDVAIIPYRMTRQVANANPLKLREYLATGKPVVSARSEEHTPELQSLMRSSYAVFCLKKKNKNTTQT